MISTVPSGLKINEKFVPDKVSLQAALTGTDSSWPHLVELMGVKRSRLCFSD